jgi:hypothetical protein
VIAQIVLVTSMALGAQLPPGKAPTTCTVDPQSVLSRAPSGVVEVSNLEFIRLQARVPKRPLPASGVLYALQVEATVYAAPLNGKRSAVLAKVASVGSGSDGTTDFVDFVLDIPLEPSERDAAIRKYLKEVGGPAAAEQAFAGIFRQHRLGRFEVECRVLDEGRVVGTARTELAVVFTGNFFDQEGFREN